MANLKALGTGAKAALLGGAAAIVSLAGYGIWAVNQVPPSQTVAAPEPAASELVTPEPAAPEPAGAPAPTPAPDAAEPAPEPDPTADAAAAPPADTEPAAAIIPSFDLVRVEPDGSTVVAGRAEPGSRIVLRVDGAEISASTADANGDFVGLFVLEGSLTARILTMTSILADQSEVAAEAEVVLAPTDAPTDAPAVVAAAAPEAADPQAQAAAADPAADPAAAQAATPDLSAAQAPAALLVTKDGASVLQSGQTAAADQAADLTADLTIETISYTPEGDVQLAGRAAPRAALRLYLDNAAVMDLQVADDGQWTAKMPPIAPGIYTLRADQLAADGSVTARFETPFKRETAQALAAVLQPEAVPVAVPEAEPTVVAEATDAPKTADPAAPAQSVADTVAPAVALAVTPDVSEPVAEASAEPQTAVLGPPAPVSITVQPGFTLWGIASKQFGDGVMYVQVYQANKDKIRDPDLIYPGQVFVIPKASE